MVEAMKMEFAVKAGTSGKVTRIHVEEGAILAPGQKLLDFEEGKHE
jgi:acetyl-CoA carboxylase biotin carboxyl carrier protein